MSQLWYCNHNSKRYATFLYKLDGGKLYQVNAGFESQPDAWREIECARVRTINVDLLSVTYDACGRIGPISFQLARYD